MMRSRLPPVESPFLRRTVSPANCGRAGGRVAADAGKPVRGKDVLITAERDELARLRRRGRQFEQQRDILAKATTWFAAKDVKTSIGSTNS